MTCEEFRDLVPDMLDEQIDINVAKACQEHIDHCTECKAYYDDMQQLASMLTPKHSPVEQHKPQRLTEPPKARHATVHKMLRIAAVVLVFVAGIAVGVTGLFPSKAKAVEVSTFTFYDGAQSVHNVGSYAMELYVRNRPDDNFEDISPKYAFCHVSVNAINQNDTLCWRVTKDDGRTVVCDGREQYIWDNGYRNPIRASADTHTLGYLEIFVHPGRLLELERNMADKKELKVDYADNDTSRVITVETLKTTNITPLDDDNPIIKNQLIIENTFSKGDNLLRKVRAWMVKDGQKTLVLRTGEIRYNIWMSRTDIVAIPSAVKTAATNIVQSLQVKGSKALQLQQESATQAAERVMKALTSVDTVKVAGALYQYNGYIGRMLKKYRGAKVGNFSKPKTTDDYPGVYVFYDITFANGKSERRFLGLRANESHLWYVDGGL